MTGTRTEGIALTEAEKWFSYKGRIGVGQYWGRFALLWVVEFAIVYSVLGSVSTQQSLESINPIFWIVTLAGIWPSTALAWKRLHDTGRAGPMFFFVLIPLVGFILWLVWSLTAGSPRSNTYGPATSYRWNR